MFYLGITENELLGSVGNMKSEGPSEISVHEGIFKNKFVTTIWIKINMSLPITKANGPEKFSSDLSDKEVQIVMSKCW